MDKPAASARPPRPRRPPPPPRPPKTTRRPKGDRRHLQLDRTANTLTVGTTDLNTNDKTHRHRQRQEGGLRRPEGRDEGHGFLRREGREEVGHAHQREVSAGVLKAVFERCNGRRRAIRRLLFDDPCTSMPLPRPSHPPGPWRGRGSGAVRRCRSARPWHTLSSSVCSPRRSFSKPLAADARHLGHPLWIPGTTC